jgi:hypothetical protein
MRRDSALLTEQITHFSPLLETPATEFMVNSIKRMLAGWDRGGTELHGHHKH